VQDIQAVAIKLEAASERVLFILLAHDGTVNRMGSGSLPVTDGDLYIGLAQPPLLDSALEALSDEMLRYTGSYDISEKSGDPCRLEILLWFADESHDGFEFFYGSESEGPPPDIAGFVRNAAMVTQEWYEGQQRMVADPRNQVAPPWQQERRPWWKFW
jgi:hypothetical protein